MMPTTIRVFGGSAGDRDLAAQRASEYIAAVEEAGGQYIDSHSTLSHYNNGVLFLITVVCKERDSEDQPGIH